MRSSIQKMIIYCLCYFLGFFVAAEETDFSKEYYSDIAGYHAVAKKNSNDKEEAIRLAKSDAIKHIFSEIGKDELFQQMFIFAMPQFIIVEGTKTEKKDNTYYTTVKLVIDQNAVLMAEESYTSAVNEIFIKAEKILEEVEKFLQDAENAELNLRMSEALLFYRSAKLRCSEIEDLVKNIKDTSIKSLKGNNIIILEKMTNNYFSRADHGFSRIEAIETAIEKDSALNEVTKIFELLLDEMKAIEAVINRNVDWQPFYDLQKSKLENIKIDIISSIAKAKTTNDKLFFLSEQIPEERLLLKEKIAIAIDELSRMKSKLDKMKKEVELEINDPRLTRQQRAQNWNRFLSLAGDSCSYLLFHESHDILAFRYYLPFEWIVDSTPVLSPNSELNIRIENTFSSGFWIKTQFNSTNFLFNNGNSNAGLFQELALGYFQNRFIFAAGFLWDWERKINEIKAAKEKVAKIYFGGVNSSRTRTDWLLSLAYKIPQFLDPFFYAYQLNMEIDLLVRIENILLLEANVSSNSIQDTITVANTVQLDELTYNLKVCLGLGLRFPGPLVWGINYNYNSLSPINPLSAADDFEPSREKNYWSAFIEYSF